MKSIQSKTEDDVRSQPLNGTTFSRHLARNLVGKTTLGDGVTFGRRGSKDGATSDEFTSDDTRVEIEENIRGGVRIDQFRV